MAKVKTTFCCSQCGYISAVPLGRCPECQAWNTLVATEKDVTPSKPGPRRVAALKPKPTRLADVVVPVDMHLPSGLTELDRVLGGGVMPGSYILLGGDPGIGKSTLVMQMAARYPQQQVLYVAGEESPEQIKHRAARLGVNLDHVWVYPELQVTELLATVQDLQPAILIVDSIQSIYHPDLNSAPGGVGQIRECAGVLMQVAKAMGITTVLVGHVTKDGQLSGPKLLEHMVDVVLTFEGDKYQPLRVLRANKNRFGNTQEVGLFEMTETGLDPVTDLSTRFTGQNRLNPLPGSALTITLEGRRPLLVELQALVTPSAYASPRRLANGVDLNRLHQVLAVVEKQLGVDCSRLDVYVNAVGGFTVEEPAADLAMAMAILTSWRQVSLPPHWVLVGELGLTGELRSIAGLPVRLTESERLGLHHVLHPADSRLGKVPTLPKVTAHPVKTLLTAVTTVLGNIN
jgi:DNA repair protein RadA/Sms